LNILVPVKSVVDVELNIRVKDSHIVEDGLNYILSKWDENALEAALQLKEAGGGEVTAVTVGPARSGEALRKAMAMGADKGIHINDPATEGSDSWGYARVLEAVARKGSYDLIITGRQSQDTDMGSTGAFLAALLDLPLVVNVIHMERQSEAGRLEVHRKGDGDTEVIELALPALITANDSLNEPRLASLKGIMAAKKKPLETLTLADLSLDASQVGAQGAAIEIMGFEAPPGRAAGKKFEGEPEEVTAQVVGLLASEAKIFT